jgi:hypothetical protein
MIILLICYSISRALDMKWTRQIVYVTNLDVNCYCTDPKHNKQAVLAVLLILLVTSLKATQTETSFGLHFPWLGPKFSFCIFSINLYSWACAICQSRPLDHIKRLKFIFNPTRQAGMIFGFVARHEH